MQRQHILHNFFHDPECWPGLELKTLNLNLLHTSPTLYNVTFYKKF